MNPLEESIGSAIKKAVQKKIKDAGAINIKYENEAISKIKERIRHYKKTGNKNKLSIYEAKLKQHYSVIEKLKGMKP